MGYIMFGVAVVAMIAACACFYKFGRHRSDFTVNVLLDQLKKQETKIVDEKSANYRLEIANTILAEQLNKLHRQKKLGDAKPALIQLEKEKMSRDYNRLYHANQELQARNRELQEALDVLLPMELEEDLGHTTVQDTRTIAGVIYSHPVPTDSGSGPN